MKIPAGLPGLKGFRSPREVIVQAVGVYSRFALSAADVEERPVRREVISHSQCTAGLWANGAATKAEHRTHKGLNNAIEVSHKPARKREKISGRFRSHRQARNDAFGLRNNDTAEMRP